MKSPHFSHVIVGAAVCTFIPVGVYVAHGLTEREPEANECHVTREGSRPAEYGREYWQTFGCADGYEFTLVWGETTLTNIIWNLPEATS